MLTKVTTILPFTADDLLNYCSLCYRHHHYNTMTPMFTKEDHDFLDMLFGKFKSMDDDMFDLHDDDTCCDHLELERRAAELEMTVDEMLHADL